MGGLNQNEMKEILQRFKNEIMNYICGDIRGRRMEFEDEEVNIEVPFSMDQVHAWGGLMKFLPERWEFIPMALY